MNADGGVDEIMLLGELNATVQRSRPRPTADGDNGLHAGLTRPRQYLLAVSAELLHLEMGVESTRTSRRSSVISHQWSAKSSPWGRPLSAVHAERSSAVPTKPPQWKSAIYNLKSAICNLHST